MRPNFGLTGIACALTVAASLGGCSLILGDFTQGSGGADAGGQDGTVMPPPDASAGDGAHEASAGDAAHDAQGANDATPPTDGGGCSSSALFCNGACVPNDIHNCGRCGNDCSALHNVGSIACTNGACSYMCAPGFANCAEGGTGCNDNLAQQGNCGGCGVTCSGSMPVCASNSTGAGCASSCSGVKGTLCGSSCVDTTSDPQNCGGCDAGCTTMVPNAQPGCMASMCGFACDATYTLCNGACILTQPDTTAGVFVAPGGGTGACGSEAQPCGTIALGLAAVASSQGTKSVIYLANGTYPETVMLPAGITLQGGWLDTGGQWTHQCVANPEAGAVIQAPAGADRVVVANYAGSATLDTLTLQNATTAAAGQTLYAVFASGSSTQLLLKNVAIDVAAGGPGTTGATGSAGSPGSGSCTPAGTGGSGSPGSAGAAASAGAYSVAGYSPNTGGTGTGGASGQIGATGLAGTCETETDCSDNGSGSCVSAPITCCGAAGKSGCPGGGSGPGSPGSGGGSSIGVFDWGATVTVTGGAMTTGNGGNGGNGGPGGTFGSGSQGASGAAGKYGGPTCHLGPTGCGTTDTCSCIAPQLPCGGGGAGSYGGNGGTGGTGGGGSAGDSYCWYQGGGGMVTANGTTCMNGQPGAGGNAGQANAGASGQSGMHN